MIVAELHQFKGLRSFGWAAFFVWSVSPCLPIFRIWVEPETDPDQINLILALLYTHLRNARGWEPEYKGKHLLYALREIAVKIPALAASGRRSNLANCSCRKQMPLACVSSGHAVFVP